MLATGDTFTNGRYPNIDFADGGNIKGMIAAADLNRKLCNDKSRIVPGHGLVADKAVLLDYRTMLETVRERMAQLVKEAKERGRRGGGKALRRPRRQMGSDRTRSQEFRPRGLALARRQARHQAADQADPAPELMR